VATQITATTPRTRPAPRLGVLEVAILAVIAVAVIGVGVWSQAGSIRDVTTHSQAYAMGYPLHGGLAGPSRVGQVSTVDFAARYGPGYPFHGGLAGPSQSLSAVDPAARYGPGYSFHGGLAGPSRFDSGD
jgi:hypothetical protein